MQDSSYDDLKRKFYKHPKGNSLPPSSLRVLEKAQTQLQMLVEEAKSCMELLEQIAFKPNPLTQADYIQLMINSEKSEKGRMGRASNPS